MVKLFGLSNNKLPFGQSCCKVEPFSEVVHFSTPGLRRMFSHRERKRVVWAVWPSREKVIFSLKI